MARVMRVIKSSCCSEAHLLTNVGEKIIARLEFIQLNGTANVPI